MNLNELVDSLIELSCHEMPDEARKSLDDATSYEATSRILRHDKTIL